jgi:cytochrome c oxidase subunit 2
LSPAGRDAAAIADLWWLMLILGVVVFALVTAALLVGLRRGSSATVHDDRDHDDRDHDGDHRPDHDRSTARRWMVAGGVVLPVVVIGVVLAATLVTMRRTAASEHTEFTVEVIGHQYWFEVRYPDEGVVGANEIHLPADVPVEILLRSEDVIHSLWVPAVSGKLDLLPDRTNRLTVVAERGSYPGRCAEFCGTSHAAMDIVLIAHPPDELAAWLAAQREPAVEPTDDEARRGAELFESAGCARCHTVAGTGADGEDGPDLTHVASRELLAGGAVDPTAPDLVEWITDPHSVKPGVSMPPAELPDADVDALVAYLRSLT